MEGKRGPQKHGHCKSPGARAGLGIFQGPQDGVCTWSLSARGHEVVRARTGKWSDEVGL